MVKVTVPGKVHLIGEHAVVYGEPAIIAAVGLRNFVEAEKSGEVRFTDDKLHISEEFPVQKIKEFSEKLDSLWEDCFRRRDFSELFSYFRNEKANFKKACIGKSLREFGIDSGVSMRTGGNIPHGSGLGSSAALAVAIPKAIAEVYGIKTSIERINEIAYSLEKLLHGTPSGGDNTTCAYGGLIWFRKDKNGKPRIDSLKNEIPYTLENFVLTHIKQPEKTTGELVLGLRNLDPSFRDPRIKAIGQASREMRSALRNNDFKKVKDMINLSWKNLSELGLSTPEVDEIIAKIVTMGGAAKLCGACGGGVMLACHENKDSLKKVIKESGYNPMETELGVDGVRVE